MSAAESFVIAVDGPSGTGKSTVSRAVATRLGAGYLDTGALYRIVTVHVLNAGIDPHDDAGVSRSLSGLELAPPLDPAEQRHLLDGVDVTARIREADVTAAVSPVAANPAVRAFLLDVQRTLAHRGRMVVEGRDIGTVIAPDAPVKIYLTADAKERAARRHAQDAARPTGGAPGSAETPAAGGSDIADVAASLARRDAADSSRATAPLKAAADAVIVDSTTLTIDETVEAVLDAASQAGIR